MRLFYLVLFIFPLVCQSQVPKRQTLAAAGNSQLVQQPTGTYFIYQSIGQTGVIGNFNVEQTQLRQGYIQPLPAIVLGGDPNALEVVVFPNPFLEGVQVTLENGLGDAVEMQLFDASGRLILQDTYEPTNQLRISLPQLSQGNYFLKLVSGRQQATKQLIKL
jgi:hypothetical protein